MTTGFFKRSVCIILLAAFHECANAQWVKTGGPPGMNVNVFYQRGNNLFGGTSNGTFKSTNNGVTWIAANNGIRDKNVFSFTSNHNFLFAGTDTGVFRSPDNGATWQPAYHGIEGKFVYSFLFANGFLFAGTSGGLYKSSNEGITWSDANGNALTSSTIHDIAYAPPHLVVIADNLVFYSDDNGDSWNYNSNSPFIFGVNPSFFAQHDSILLASGSVVFRSFDGGINWSNSITVTDGSNIDGLVRANNLIVAGTKKGLFFSSNFGKKWTATGTNNIRKGSWFTHDFYRSGNNYLLAYDEIGVGYSADSGKNWDYTLKGFPPSSNIDNAIIFANNAIITGTHGDGVYKSTNEGVTWKRTGTASNADTLFNSNIYALLRLKNIILAGTCGNGLYRSNDNGVSWTHITNGLPKQQGTGYLCVHSLAKTNKAVLIATDQGLYYSNDSGLTWKTTNLSSKNAVAVAANDSVACVGVENLQGPSEIYRSVNNAASWNVVFQSFFDDWASMASDGKSYFYIGTLASSNYVSNNNGAGWQTVGPGMPSGSGGFAIGVSKKNVFIGNSGGVYLSKNHGASFTEVNTGFDKNHAVQGFAISSTDVYAGLFQNGIWKRPLSDFGITTLQKNEESELPVSFSPNPLTSQSKLTYNVASNERVVINLYNTNGNLIRKLKDGLQVAGSYTIVMNKTGLHAGNYFLSVIAGDKHAVVNVVVNGN
jgi:hypothetical protein